MAYEFPVRTSPDQRKQLPSLRSLSLLDYTPPMETDNSQMLPPLQSQPLGSSFLSAPADMSTARVRRWSTADGVPEPVSLPSRGSATRSSMQDSYCYPRSRAITDPQNAMLSNPSTPYAAERSYGWNNMPSPALSGYSLPSSASRSSFSRGSFDQSSNFDPISPYTSYSPSLNSNGSPLNSPMRRMPSWTEEPVMQEVDPQQQLYLEQEERSFQRRPPAMNPPPRRNMAWGRSRSNFSSFQIKQLEALWAQVQYPSYDEVEDVSVATGLVSLSTSFMFHARLIKHLRVTNKFGLGFAIADVQVDKRWIKQKKSEDEAGTDYLGML